MDFDLNNCASDDFFLINNINLWHNTEIKVLPFSRCMHLTLRHNTLAMLPHVSSSWTSHLLWLLPWWPGGAALYHQSQLEDLNTHLQKQNFAMLEPLMIGLRQGYPASLNLIRGLVRVMDIVTMERDCDSRVKARLGRHVNVIGLQ